MKYYIYMTAAFALLLITAGIASSSGPPVSVPVPSSFMISESGKAMDDGSNEYNPGPGLITFARNGETLYVRVPAPARNGTRLVSLEDRGSGIVFRNNTMLLPVYAAGKLAGSLVATTDNLSAERGGYIGPVTGLELGLAGGSATSGGINYTAGAVILLRDLPAEAGYCISFGRNSTVEEAVASDLGAGGRAIAALSPTLAIESANLPSEDAVSYVIVTIQARSEGPGPYDANNTTLYRYNDSRLSGIRPQIVRTENGTLYQAVISGPGQFALAAARLPDHAVTGPSAIDTGGLAVIGGVLAILLIALAAMVRRVTKR